MESYDLVIDCHFDSDFDQNFGQCYGPRYGESSDQCTGLGSVLDFDSGLDQMPVCS